MNRAERRAAAKEYQSQLARGAVELEAPSATKTTITFAYAAGENVRTLWHQSVLACAARSHQHGFLLRPRLCESGPRIDKARNMLVEAFLDTDDEYLLFCDTDIVFAPQDVKALLEVDAPIAGALYFTAAAGMEPWPVALEGPNEEGKYPPIDLPEPPEDFDDLPELEQVAWMTAATQPRTVAAVGCGLMLIRRDVVIDVASAYDGLPFAYADDRGEDVTFCLRAGELGYETVLVPAARVGHVKASVL